MVDEDKWLEITSLTNLRKTATTSTSAVIEVVEGEGKGNDEKMSIADSKRLDLELEKSSGEKNWNWKSSSSSSSVMSSSPACWPFVTPHDNVTAQPTTCLSSKNKIPVDKRLRKKAFPPHKVLLNLDFNQNHTIVCENPVSDTKRLNHHQLCVSDPSNLNINKPPSSSSSSSSNVIRGHLKPSEAPLNSYSNENSTLTDHHVGNGDCLKDNAKSMDANIMDTVENMKSRLTKLTSLLAEKVKIIEQQEINIGNLHRKLAAQTTESLSLDFDYCDISRDCDSEDSPTHQSQTETTINNDDGDGTNDNNNHNCVQHNDHSCSLQQNPVIYKNIEIQKVSNVKKIETRNIRVHDCIQEKMDNDQDLSATDNSDNNQNNNNNNNNNNNGNAHEMNKDDKSSSIKKGAHCKNCRRMSKKNIMMMKKMENGGKTTKTKIYPLLLDDRLDTLVKKMDHLEAELPKRIQAICAEFIQKSGLLGLYGLTHYLDCNTTNICPCKACREIEAMTVEEEKENIVEFFTTRTTPSQKKLNPMVSIMRKFCDKTQSLSNPPPPLLLPQNPLKWNKSPIIKPKTNLSANYRFLHHQHHLNHHQQQRNLQSHQHESNTVKVKNFLSSTEKSKDVNNAPNTDDIVNSNNSFDFHAVEEKLCSIENVVDKFKHYLISLLLNRFKT